ncbi:MAG TPA: asparagine--tRNA ligase, partial [Thermoprotei archaeon]|nr:asparagine--tRNA ligase [Thermoprotei archaeon]
MLTGGVIIEFTKIKNVFEEGIPGRKYKIRGWIYRRREFKDKIFILIRDSSGIIQGILPKTSIDNSTLKNISIEASIELVGTLREDKRAPGGYEIDIENIKVIGPSNNFPITKDFSREFLLNVRHLWVRSRKMTSILK